jgi:hypothetical protein
MSALGQKQTSDRRLLMSALPPKADITKRDWHVRFVPEADSDTILNAPCAAAIGLRDRHRQALDRTEARTRTPSDLLLGNRERKLRPAA